MKTHITIVLFLLVCFQLRSQIIIDNTDMPAQGDTFRISVSVAIPGGYMQTAMDTLWDFSSLEPVSQRVDTFLSINNVPVFYKIIFIPNIVANLVSPRDESIIPGLPVTDMYDFYMNNTASFANVGYAFTIQGIPVPAKYDVPDNQYQFPCTVGNEWSSESTIQLTVPSILYFTSNRFRTNTVDGWGILKTPFGSFQVIRVKSVISQRDSIYIDSLGFGFPIERNITEYKWLGKNQGIPLLQVNEEGLSVTATYRDSVRMPATPLTIYIGADTVVPKGTSLTSYASVTGGMPPYHVFWNTLDTGLDMTLTINEEQTVMAIVTDALQNIASDSRLVTIKYPPGYFEPEPVYLSLRPNPSAGRVILSGPDFRTHCKAEVFTPQGNRVRVISLAPGSSKEYLLDLSGLPSGIYTIRITGTKKISIGKLIILNN